jgi:DNA gyrase subunit A
VVRRRSEHDLARAEDRAHILEGRLRALKHVDSVVAVIRNSADRDEARAALRGEVDPGDLDGEHDVPSATAFDFSGDQADHIVRMQLGSLTSMEAAEIEAEYEDVQAEIERLETILDDEGELLAVIKEELQAVKDEYGDERKTTFVESDEITNEDLIPEEDVLVVVTEDDYIKRMPVDRFDPQNRGGKGIIGADPKESDRVSKVFRANTHDYLLCFTNRGQVYRLKTYEVPEMSRTARGKSAVNLIDLDDGEEITAVVNTDDFEPGECITMVTRRGYVKRTCVEDFENILSTGIIAAKLEDRDELVDVGVTDGTEDLVIATEQGMTIRFDESEAREMGRTARGVRGIDLRGEDRVAGLVATDGTDEGNLLTVTKNGFGKRTPLSKYRAQSRYGKGLIDIKTAERNGPVSTVKAVTPEDHLVIMSESGQIMRIRAGDVSEVGRNTKGVVVMRLEQDDRVASVDVVPTAVDEDET